MPVATTAPPSTVSMALDAVANAVLALVSGSPRPTHQQLATSVQRRFGIEVSPDNLRVWLARRHAAAVRATVAPAVRCPLDSHLELVIELRDPSRNEGGVYLWTQVLAQLKLLDPALAEYTPEGLRSWYSRRARRGSKAQIAAANALAGRDTLSAPGGASPRLASVDDDSCYVTLTVDQAGAPAPISTSDAPADARASAPAVAAVGSDAKRAEAADELELLRGNNVNELGGLLGKFLPQQASQ
jgi:hypothetical protein